MFTYLHAFTRNEINNNLSSIKILIKSHQSYEYEYMQSGRVETILFVQFTCVLSRSRLRSPNRTTILRSAHQHIVSTTSALSIFIMFGINMGYVRLTEHKFRHFFFNNFTSFITSISCTDMVSPISYFDFWSSSCYVLLLLSARNCATRST